MFNPSAYGYERHVLPESPVFLGYGEGYLNFGLDLSEQSKQFLEGVKSIIRKYRQTTHLADSYLHDSGISDLEPNEFHFGILPSNGKGDWADFSSLKEAKEFEIIRNRVWQELDQLVRGHG